MSAKFSWDPAVEALPNPNAGGKGQPVSKEQKVGECRYWKLLVRKFKRRRCRQKANKTTSSFIKNQSDHLYNSSHFKETHLSHHITNATNLKNMSYFAPPPTPLAIFPAFITQNPENLVVKAKHFSWSRYITDLDGCPLLTITGGYLSRRKSVYDNHGTRICTIHGKRPTSPQNKPKKRTYYYAKSPKGGKRLFEIDFGINGGLNATGFVNAVRRQRI
jgi:hypothetical protein